MKKILLTVLAIIMLALTGGIAMAQTFNYPLKGKQGFNLTEKTRDGLHINLYSGRYLLACTFFESIIVPCLARNLRDDITIYGKSNETGAVNNSNRRLLQNCARLAVANNYEISEFAGQ
jgi:hypothetical protein